MRARWKPLFWTCAAAVLILSLLPPTPYMPTTGWDKTNHVLGFAVLAILGCRAYATRIATTLSGLLLYGGLIEVLQSFTPDRYAEWEDVIADGIGIVAGYGISFFLKKRN
jgi:VanZ family protein